MFNSSWSCLELTNSFLYVEKLHTPDDSVFTRSSGVGSVYSPDYFLQRAIFWTKLKINVPEGPVNVEATSEGPVNVEATSEHF